MSRAAKPGQQIEMTGAIPLISSQRYLDPATVARKARTFKVFVVRIVTCELRGRVYRVLVDGHHNLAAARLAGVEPAWRGANRKLQRAMQEMGPAAFARMLINNLTDADWYDVETGMVVLELLGTERKFA